MAGTFANSVGAQTLLLTHFSARYSHIPSSNESSGEGVDTSDVDAAVAPLVAEAAAYCPNTRVIAAHDFMQYTI